MSSTDIWTAFASELNEQTLESYRRSVDTQAAFADAWLDASEEGLERLADTDADGVAIDPAEMRDLWLDAANESAKEVMGTSAFANATGRSVEDAMESLRDAEESNEETLRAMGLAGRSDVEEVGERLLELERRQQRVEEKLDDVLDALSE